MPKAYEGGDAVLEKGEYELYIQDAKEYEPKSGGNTMLELKLVVQSGPMKGQSFTAKLADFKVSILSRAFNVDKHKDELGRVYYDWTAVDFIKRSFQCQVEPQEFNGRTYNNVNAIKGEFKEIEPPDLGEEEPRF